MFIIKLTLSFKPNRPDLQRGQPQPMTDDADQCSKEKPARDGLQAGEGSAHGPACPFTLAHPDHPSVPSFSGIVPLPTDTFSAICIHSPTQVIDVNGRQLLSMGGCMCPSPVSQNQPTKFGSQMALKGLRASFPLPLSLLFASMECSSSCLWAQHSNKGGGTLRGN